jgi:hypothetical protein
VHRSLLPAGAPSSLPPGALADNRALPAPAAIGFNVETVTYKNIKFQVWDLGGQTSIRPYWRCYYPNTQAIIYVVDSSDVERIGISKEEFHAILDEEELKDALILVYANKQVRSWAAPHLGSAPPWPPAALPQAAPRARRLVRRAHSLPRCCAAWSGTQARRPGCPAGPAWRAVGCADSRGAGAARHQEQGLGHLQDVGGQGRGPVRGPGLALYAAEEPAQVAPAGAWARPGGRGGGGGARGDRVPAQHVGAEGSQEQCGCALSEGRPAFGRP